MYSIQDLIKLLNELKEVLIALASVLLLLITIWRIIWQEVKTEKKKGE